MMRTKVLNVQLDPVEMMIEFQELQKGTKQTTTYDTLIKCRAAKIPKLEV